MNIFVLNTGRCGSTTFIKACRHITNFSSAHESRVGLLGEARFNYPNNHIEADNRLSWLLGRLDRHYGDDAIYVHLQRNTNATAISYAKRLFPGGIIPAYRIAILKDVPTETSDVSVALDYCCTVNSNIELFLRDKTKKMDFVLENAKQDFQKFWELIHAEGDLDAALSEFHITYNPSAQPIADQPKPSNLLIRTMEKVRRLIIKLPDFIKNA
jgi:hypothetical protein